MDIYKRFNSYKIKKINLNESVKGKNKNQYKQPKQDTEGYFLSTFKNISENKKVFNSILKRSISQNRNDTSDKSSSTLIKNQLLKNIKDFYLQEDQASVKTIYSKISKNKKFQRRSITNDFGRMQDNVSGSSSPHIINRKKTYKTNFVNKNLKKSENSKGNKINKKLILRVQSKNKDYIYGEIKNDDELFSPSSENVNVIQNSKKKVQNNFNLRPTKKSKNSSNNSISILSKDYKNFSENIRMSKSLKSKNIDNNGYNFSLFFNIGNSKASKKQMNSSTIISKILKDNCYVKDNNFNNNFIKQKNKNNILNDKILDIKKSKNKKVKFSSRLCLRNFNKKKSNKSNNKFNTIILADQFKQNNLLTILRTNKPNEMKNDTNKIMDIFAMDEVDKKLKESLISIDRTELRRELQELETNEICQVIEKLPVINNNNSNIETGLTNIYDDKNKEDKKNEFQDTNIRLFKCKSTIYSEKYRFLKRKTMVYDSLDDEEIEEVEINSIYISPDSFIVYLIDSIILLSSFIELFYFSIYIAKKSDFCRNIYDFNEIMFYFIDIFYIIDLITEFFRAYYNFDEFLIKKNSDICKRYLKSWFITDFIEAIPLYIIFNISEEKCNLDSVYQSSYYNLNMDNHQYIFLILKILKIFKVFAKNTVLNKFKKLANETEFFYQFETVLFTVFIFISSLNITSCLFIFFGRNSYPGWIIDCNMQNNSFIHIYIAAIYYIMTTVTTVGYGDVLITSIHERIFQILILIVGTCAYSWIVTYISNNIQKIQEKSLDYEHKMSILKEIKISNPYLTDNLYNKICRYLQYNRIEQKNNNEIIINCLPYPLKNTLFMEMYKPIIKNFNIFKSFENSNFIVKVVTSFKPVLSVEGDVLIQEGDFVEDIIFVKEGVVSLEICIDLEYPQQYIEGYLKETGFGKSNYNIKSQRSSLSNSHINTFKNSLNPSSTIKNKLDDIKENENKNKISIDSNGSEFEKNKKYIKIIDIRKNEHFGDILMFLNERAPFRIKVKSKKAEIYLLNKTDAIEISTLYPNIWKRIMKKSLFNMKQIRNLARKLLIIFSQRNGIILNEDIFNQMDKTFTTASKLDEDDLNFSKSNSESEKEKMDDNNNIPEKNKKQSINTIIYEEENENHDPCDNDLDNKKEKNVDMLKNNLCNKNNLNNLKYNQSSLKNNNDDTKIATSLFKKAKNSKNKLSKKYKELAQSDRLEIKDNSVNISIHNKEGKNSDNVLFRKKLSSLPLLSKNRSMPKENKKNKDLEKDEDGESENDIKVKRSVSNLNIHVSNGFEFLGPTPFKREEVNSEIYPNEVFIQNNFLKTEQQSIESPENLSDSSNENNFGNINSKQLIVKKRSKYNSNNSIIKNSMNIMDSQNEKKIFDQKSNSSSISSNKNERNVNVCCSSKLNEENDCKIFKHQSSNTNKYFDNLSIISIFSTTINSSYDNFNYFTNYQFSKDLGLQQKTFRFIKEKCLRFTNTLNKTNIDPLIKHNLFTNIKKKNKPNNSINASPQLNHKKSRKENEFLSVINKETKRNSSFVSNIKKKISKTPIKERNKLIHLNSSNPYFTKKSKNDSAIIKSSCNISDNENSNLDVVNNNEKKNNVKKSSKNNINNPEETELNFYGKMKTLRGSNIRNIKSVITQNNRKNKRKMSYMDMISNNILENRQTLENPQEFYTGLFTDLVQNKKIVNKKVYKTKNNNKINLSKTKVNEDINSRNKNRLQRHHISRISSTNFENYENLKKNSTTKEALVCSNIELP